MKKAIILIGACRYNRGSEAIARGIVRMLKESVPNCRIILSSRDDNTGNSLNIEGIDRYIKRFTYNRNNKILRYGIGVLRYIFHLKHFTNWINHSELLKECKSADLIIVVGADNYDSSYGAFADMHSINKTLRKTTNGRMVFLNCSIDPDNINDKITKDLNLFDKITARESITYHALMEKLNPKKLEYFPDIAFIMQPKKVDLPICFSLDKVVGINLSPLILNTHYTAHKDEILKAYHNIIEYIINIMGFQVLLIPHVMDDTDLKVLRDLYEKYMDNKSVSLIESERYSAPELKYIISNCDMFFGARTHSTIAAYSSCVPTLVLGYSTKSRGIALDLFGKIDGYVIAVQDIANDSKLVQDFKLFAENTEQTRALLQKKIPGYIEQILDYRRFFTRLFHSGKTEEKDD